MTPRAHAEKLLTSLPKPSRRTHYSSGTRKALIKHAQTLFTQDGYAGTSLDAIVREAKVTKGALYHHFSGKQAVFEAVFELVEAEAAKTIRKALRGHSDPWEKARAGLGAFLEIVQQPEYQRVVIQEGPAILGYERFRESEERSAYAIVNEIVRSTLQASTWDLDEEMTATFTQIFFGALSAAGESVTGATDPDAAVARVESAVTFLLAGIRALVEAGVNVATAADYLEDPDNASEPE